MDCLFCKMIKGDIPCKKIYEDEYVIAILDLHPDADGHTLIIPKKHFTDFIELDDEYLTHIMNIAKELSKDLIKCFNATSLSLRINYLDSQYIKHFHLHLLPNYGFKKPSLTQEEAFIKFNEYKNGNHD